MISQICVDMDGVLCDFMLATIDLFGLSAHEVYENWPLGEYETASRMGVSENEMWNAIHGRGEAHWFEMQPFPWCHELLEMCSSHAPTILLSSPSKHPTSLAGKWRWIEKHLPDYSRQFLIGPKKEFCARENAVLIDDYDFNCTKFREHGGKAIVFPQIWNSQFEESLQPLEYTRRHLESFVK